MKTLTPQQKAKVTKEYRLALREMLGDLSVDDDSGDGYYVLSVNKDTYDAWLIASAKAMRYGVNGL
jgi:hypothetical protein